MAEGDYRAQSEENTQTNTALPSNGSYTADSSGQVLGVNIGQINNSLPSLGKLPGYQLVADTINAGAQIFNTAVKISFSEIGVWRQLIQFGGRVHTSEDTDPANRQNLVSNLDPAGYIAPSVLPSRDDTTNEYVFRAGDYFLPLSFSYSIQGEKKLSLSRLVDGPEIIQQMHINSEVVTLFIRMERDPNRIKGTVTAQNMSFIDATVPGITAYAASEYEQDFVYYEVRKLGVVLRTLYREANVFRIYHDTLNTEFGMDYVLLQSFDMRANPGTTVVDLTLVLRGVNMTENAIVFDEGTIDTDSSAGGGPRA